MENQKNDFDDIILEKSNKNEKIKKILLRIIALVILFLIIMIVMKLINHNGSENAQRNLLPSEPLTQDNNQDNNKDLAFENLPITDNNLAEDQFEALKKQFQEEQNASKNIINSDFINDDNTQELSAKSPSIVENKIETNASKEELKQSIKTNKQVKKEPKKQVLDKEKKIDDLFKNVNAKDANVSNVPSGIYVQIFSLTNLDQKSKDLALVKQKGYDYKLYKTTLNGKEITKVLIGPFERTNIKAQLAKIRKDITKDAFSFVLE